MGKQHRQHREVSFTTGGLSPAPFAEKESETVRWLQLDSSEVIPSPYPDVRLRFEQRNGSWICTGLYLLTEGTLTAQELTERLPFAKLTSSAAEGLALLTDTGPPRITAPRRRGRLGNSDEFLKQIAALYRYALGHPQHHRAPVAFIRAQRELWRQNHEPHEDTVRRWVHQARERGFLGASIPGKPGERPIVAPDEGLET